MNSREKMINEYMEIFSYPGKEVAVFPDEIFKQLFSFEFVTGWKVVTYYSPHGDIEIISKSEARRRQNET